MSVALEKLIAGQFDAHLKALLQKGSVDTAQGRLVRLNGMVIHGLITPYKLSKQYRTTLRELSGMSNADKLFAQAVPSGDSLCEQLALHGVRSEVLHGPGHRVHLPARHKAREQLSAQAHGGGHERAPEGVVALIHARVAWDLVGGVPDDL